MMSSWYSCAVDMMVSIEEYLSYGQEQTHTSWKRHDRCRSRPIQAEQSVADSRRQARCRTWPDERPLAGPRHHRGDGAVSAGRLASARDGRQPSERAEDR